MVKYLTGKCLHQFRLIAHVVAIAGIVLGLASTLSAQDRLFALLVDGPGSVLARQYLIEIDTRHDSFGEVRKAFPLPGDFSTPPLAIGGGRFLVWLSSSGTDIHVFDTVAEHAGTLRGVLPFGSSILTADAPGLRVFVRVPQGVLIFDGRTGAVRAIPAPAVSRWLVGAFGAYAPSIDRLFVGGQTEPNTSPEVLIVDAGAGVVEKTLTLPRIFLTGLGVDHGGSRLFVGGAPFSLAAPDSAGVYVFDPQSGLPLAHHPIAPSYLTLRNPFHLDQSRGRMLVTTSDPAFTPGAVYGDRLAAFSLYTAAHLGTIESRMPLWDDTSLTPFQALTGPRSPLYVFSSAMLSRDTCGRADLEARNASTGALERRASVIQTWQVAAGAFGCMPHLTLLSPPAAPAIQDPVVSGNRVTLSWTPSYDALHYDVEAGSSPGLSNLAVSPGHSGTAIGIDGVPSGRYFVRVRAINWIGRSLPSNEVEVVVP